MCVCVCVCVCVCERERERERRVKMRSEYLDLQDSSGRTQFVAVVLSLCCNWMEYLCVRLIVVGMIAGDDIL